MLSNKALLDQLLGENRNGDLKADVHFTNSSICKSSLVWGHCSTQLIHNRDCRLRHEQIFSTQFKKQWAKYKELAYKKSVSSLDVETSGDPWGYTYDVMKTLERDTRRVDDIVRESQLRADVTKDLYLDYPLYNDVCRKLDILVEKSNKLVESNMLEEGTAQLELVQSLEMKKSELIARFVEEYFHFQKSFEEGGLYSRNPLILNPPTDEIHPAPAAAAILAERNSQEMAMNSVPLLDPPLHYIPKMQSIQHQGNEEIKLESGSTGEGELLPVKINYFEAMSEDEIEREKDRTRHYHCILSSRDIEILGLKEAKTYEEAYELLQKQKLRVCNVCGLILSLYDPAQRVTEHFLGKTHTALRAVRSFFSNLKTHRIYPLSAAAFADKGLAPEDIFPRNYTTLPDDYFNTAKSILEESPISKSETIPEEIADWDNLSYDPETRDFFSRVKEYEAKRLLLLEDHHYNFNRSDTSIRSAKPTQNKKNTQRKHHGTDRYYTDRRSKERRERYSRDRRSRSRDRMDRRSRDRRDRSLSIEARPSHDRDY